MADDLSQALDAAAEAGAETSVRDQLVAIAGEKARLWRGDDNEAYATVFIRGVRRAVPVGSRSFKDWLQTEYAAGRSHDGWKGAPRNAVSEAVDAVQARTRTAPGVPEHAVTTRRVWARGALYIDLGDDTSRVVRVGVDGWRIETEVPVPILRTPRTGALPVPEGGGDLLGLLSRYVPTASDDDLVLVATWLLAALRAHGPFPVLALNGEAGSGKSTACRVLHRLTDPCGNLLAPPTQVRDLVAAARNNAVLVFDNLSRVDLELSDAFCRLATGAELGGRALYTDTDLATFVAVRPMVLNGIPDLANRGDLASRTLAVTLPRLRTRRDEADFWADFERDAPALFGAALDALVVGLANLPTTTTPQHRMADFAKLACAAAPALGMDAESMCRALDDNADHQAETLVEGDKVAVILRDIAETHGRWRGTATELLSVLNERVDEGAGRSRAWPSTAKLLSERVMRLAPALRTVGVDVERGHGKDRFIELRRSECKSSGSCVVCVDSVENTDKPIVYSNGSCVGSASALSVSASSTDAGRCRTDAGRRRTDADDDAENGGNPRVSTQADADDADQPTLTSLPAWEVEL